MTSPARSSLALLLALAWSAPATAATSPDAQELLALKHTVVNLVDALVQQGVLDKAAAEALIAKAERDATRAAQSTAGAPTVEPRADAAEPASEQATPKGVVRVPYVPQIVKDEIKAQLRTEMRKDLLADVNDQAKRERWGTPGALPGWVSAVKLYGDVRVRNQYDAYGDENPETLGVDNLYLNVLNLNKAGTLLAGDPAKVRLNTSEDQNRWRERLRLGLVAKLADRWALDTRMVTGNQDNPVSANLTLGNTGQRFTVQLDRAELKYDRPDDRGLNWLTVRAGRINNPWFGTELVWDEDIGFDGVAATLRQGITWPGDDAGLEAFAHDRTAWITGGAFPLQQPEFQSQDRWLVAGQVGANWEFESQDALKVGIAYYNYIHMPGKRNAPDSILRNGTAPQYLQKGNLLFNIANDTTNPNKVLLALASDYRLLDFNIAYDFARLAPYHVVFNANVVKNLGFDEGEINRRTGGLTYLYPVRDRTLGLLAGVEVGWPEVKQFGAWSVAFDYRYLQRDAVLDAFTDSDFHLGGTDTQGYRLTGLFGLTRNVWLRGRWMSAHEIDGPPLSIDVLQVDLNAKF